MKGPALAKSRVSTAQTLRIHPPLHFSLLSCFLPLLLLYATVYPQRLMILSVPLFLPVISPLPHSTASILPPLSPLPVSSPVTLFVSSSLLSHLSFLLSLFSSAPPARLTSPVSPAPPLPSSVSLCTPWVLTQTTWARGRLAEAQTEHTQLHTRTHTHTVQLTDSLTRHYTMVWGLCVMFDLCFYPCGRELVCLCVCVCVWDRKRERERDNVPSIPMTVVRGRGRQLCLLH